MYLLYGNTTMEIQYHLMWHNHASYICQQTTRSDRCRREFFSVFFFAAYGILSHSPQVLGKMGMGVRCSVLCKSLVPVRLKALRPVRHPSARATRKVGRWTLAKAGIWSPNGRSSAVKQSGRAVFWNVLSTPADVPPASCCNKSHRDPMLEIGQSGCA